MSFVARTACEEQEEQLDERFLALRQTRNRDRNHAWRLEHRDVRSELEGLWDEMRDHVRRLEANLCAKMDAWDLRHREVSDNILVAGHVLEAMTRHRDFDLALSQATEIADCIDAQLPPGEPKARFNAWWLRA